MRTRLLAVAVMGCALGMLAATTSCAQGVGSAVSPAFALYLGPGYEAPAGGGVGSAVSPAFDLWLGRLSEGSALSPPFSVDTRLPAAIVGTVRAAADGLPVAGATAELFLGSTRQQATSTDGLGHYEFFATLQGDYVLRVSKGGYSMATSDLLRYRGSTLTADLSLAGGPPAGQTLADLVIGATDLTYTPVTSGMLTLTAMVHNNGATTASNVCVRFYDASTGSGINDFVRITPDVVIASLGPGEARPASVTWTPPSGHQRFYAFADADEVIAEPTELNNGNLRDLGAAVVGRTAPRVTGVSARYDGLSDPGYIGCFLNGILGLTNAFEARVSDPDDDVVKVRFDFAGAVVEDTNGGDGWAVTYDTGELPVGTPLLKVTAVDAAGLVSAEEVVKLVVDSRPEWMVGHVEAVQGFPIGVGSEPGYFSVSFRLLNEEYLGPTLYDVAETIDSGIRILGGKETRLLGDFTLKVSVPLYPGLPWKGEGTMHVESKILDRTAREVDASAQLSFSGRDLQSVTLEYTDEAAFNLIPESAAVGTVLGVPVFVSFSLDALLRAEAEATFQANLSDYDLHLLLQLGAQGNVGLGIGLPRVANAQVVFSPRLAYGPYVNYSIGPPDLSWGSTLSWGVKGKVVGKIAWYETEFLTWEWGPWSQTWGGSLLWQQSLDSLADADSIPLPDLFPYPRAASGPGGVVGVVWVTDMDADPGQVDPEIAFSQRDSSGAWGAPERVTANERYESAPTLTFLPDGRALAVWVENSLTESEASGTLTLSEILDRQDLRYALRDGAGWSAPAPLMADSIGPYRADCLPAIAADDSGVVAVWSRAMGDSALAPGMLDVFVNHLGVAGWGTPLRLTTDALDDMAPTVCGAGRDSAIAVWVRQRASSPNLQDVVWAAGSPSGWSPLRELRVSEWDKQAPALARAPDGRVLAAWVEREHRTDSTTIAHLLTASLVAGDAAWGVVEEAFADSHLVESPVLAVDQRGIATITWRGYAGADGDLMLSLKDLSSAGSVWTQPRAITADTLTDWMATAAIDNQNNLHVIDLKSDLNAPVTAAQPPGNLFGVLNVTTLGITGDLGVSDQLNFGYRSMSCDLKLAADAVSVSDSLASVGDTVGVQCRVDNIGDVRSPATTVRFYDGAPDSGGTALPGGEAALGEIAPDSSLTVSVPWIVTAGVRTFHAVADPDNAVAEQTESNNRAAGSIGVCPDLLVDSLVVANPNPLPGTTDSLTAYVRNIGGAAADNFAVRFMRGEGLLETVAGLSLGVAESTAVTVSFVTAAGTDSLVATVDPDSAIADADRANNEASVVLSVLPDLALPADSIAYAEADSTLSATVANLGGLGSGAFQVVFYAGNPLVAGTVIDSVQVDSLGAFSMCHVSVPWHAPLGTTTVYLAADPAGLIGERNRANNGNYADVVTSALPDLVAVPGSIELQVAAGPVITLSVRVTNAGAAHSLAVGVEFFRGDPDSGGTLIGDRLLAVVPMGETTSVAVNWASPDSVQNPIFVVVDRAAGIPELAEGNNRISRLLGGVVDVEPAPALPVRLALHPARPNPFSHRTAIHFDLPMGGNVRLEIFDVAGRRVRTLVNGALAAGSHVSEWDGRGDDSALGAGVYFARLQAPGGILSRKLVRLN